MSIRKNIIALREMFDITQEELSAIAGVTRGAVSQGEGGFSEPRMGAIQKIADHFGIYKFNIIEDNGISLIDPVTKKPRVNVPLPKGAIIPKAGKAAFAPLYGTVHAGKAQDPDLYEDDIGLPESVRERHPSAFFLKVLGDCMDKVYTEYCYVLVDPDKEPRDGSIACVYIDGESVMRRLRKGANTLILSPESNNPEHKDIIISADSGHIVENIGTVVWFQSSREME